ncbi:hypothetical protein ACLOJK_005597 [Asimina triloba]
MAVQAATWGGARKQRGQDVTGSCGSLAAQAGSGRCRRVAAAGRRACRRAEDAGTRGLQAGAGGGQAGTLVEAEDGFWRAGGAGGHGRARDGPAAAQPAIDRPLNPSPSSCITSHGQHRVGGNGRQATDAIPHESRLTFFAPDTSHPT